eukprot:12395608-Alexandrium_andersonii.AAC.1
MDHELRTDRGLPSDSGLDRIAGLRVVQGSGRICVRPGQARQHESSGTISSRGRWWRFPALDC